jgi:DNA-binding XRE family transcriptional regulator
MLILKLFKSASLYQPLYMGRQPEIRASKDVLELCQLLGTSQTELLNIMAQRFGVALVQQINAETLHYSTPRAVRQWLKNNGRSPRRIIAHEIKAARYRANLTQRELAEKLGINRKYLSRLELGQRVSPERVTAIAEILGDQKLDSIISNFGQSPPNLLA